MSHQKKILIVDDDEMLRRFYSRVLAKNGYESVCAAEGDEGYDLISAPGADFDLLIVDLLMPVSTGWELIERVRNNPEINDMPIFAITGMVEEEGMLPRVVEQCQAVLFKAQFNVEEFVEQVGKLLDA